MKLLAFHDSCETQMARYFGSDFYDSSIYRIAEFLDGRVAFAVDSVELIDEMRELMKPLAFSAET